MSGLNANSSNLLSLKYQQYLSQSPLPLESRKICRIWFDYKQIDTFKMVTKFGNNLKGFVFYLPNNNYDNNSIKMKIQNRFCSLKTFFRIFHNQIDWIEIHIDIDDDIVNNDNDNNEWIVGQFFIKYNLNKNLLKDLNLSQEILSFESFLIKYDCGNMIDNLPNIKTLNINFDGNNYNYYYKIKNDNDNDDNNNVLTILLKHDKLMKLLNFSKSVETISFKFYYYYINCNIIISSIDALITQCSLNLSFVRTIIRVNSKCNLRHLEKFINQMLSRVLYKCIKCQNMSIFEIIIGNEGTRMIYSQRNTIEYKIADRKFLIDEKNKGNLQNDIKLLCQSLFKIVENMWDNNNDRKLIVNKKRHLQIRVKIEKMFQV